MRIKLTLKLLHFTYPGQYKDFRIYIIIYWPLYDINTIIYEINPIYIKGK